MSPVISHEIYLCIREPCPDCLEEYPAGVLSLVPLKADQRTEGKEIFAAGAKIFWF